MLVKAEDISKRFFRRTGSANFFYAVQPISLEILPGEVTVLTGRSGSGKTTLLNMLSGLLMPTGARYGLTIRISTVWTIKPSPAFAAKRSASCPRAEALLTH